MKDIEKITILINSLRGGGAEKVASRIAEFLIKNLNTKVEILIFENIKVYQGSTSNIIDISVLPLKLINSSLVFRLINYIGAIIRLTFYLSNQKPSIIISFLPRANVVNGLLGKLLCSTCIICEHSSIAKLYKNQVVKFIVRKAYNRCNKIIAVSKGVKDELTRIGVNPNKITIIPNPINVTEILNKTSKPPHKFIFYPNWFYVINVGRICREKGQEDIIKAAMLIPPEEPIKFIFIGDGPDKERLEKWSKRLDLNTRIYFLGWQDNPYAFLSRSHLYVHASVRETWGLSIIEAAICGLPILAYDVDYIRDLAIKDKWINLIPYGDVMGMAQNIIKMVRYKNEKEIPNGEKRLSYLGINSEKEILNRYLNEILNSHENINNNTN
jgi:N-acetylgalactosamine-N,N'-diacetylbacillosaminyl-diphospho-undecaprenol 4-alpha-N-acetylgalactosaminyltransferase